jgi:hypothetical protein
MSVGYLLQLFLLEVVGRPGFNCLESLSFIGTSLHECGRDDHRVHLNFAQPLIQKGASAITRQLKRGKIYQYSEIVLIPASINNSPIDFNSDPNFFPE